jgi:hypothetical protein
MLDVTWNHSRGPPIRGFGGDDTRLASWQQVSGSQSMKTWAVVVGVRTQLWKLVEQDPFLLLLSSSCCCGWGTYYLHSPLGDGNLEPAFMKVRAWWIWTPHLMHGVHKTNALSHDVWSQFTQDSTNNSSTWHTGLSIPVPAML